MMFALPVIAVEIGILTLNSIHTPYALAYAVTIH